MYMYYVVDWFPRKQILRFTCQGLLGSALTINTRAGLGSPGLCYSYKASANPAESSDEGWSFRVTSTSGERARPYTFY